MSTNDKKGIVESCFFWPLLALSTDSLIIAVWRTGSDRGWDLCLTGSILFTSELLAAEEMTPLHNFSFDWCKTLMQAFLQGIYFKNAARGLALMRGCSLISLTNSKSCSKLGGWCNCCVRVGREWRRVLTFVASDGGSGIFWKARIVLGSCDNGMSETSNRFVVDIDSGTASPLEYEDSAGPWWILLFDSELICGFDPPNATAELISENEVLRWCFYAQMHIPENCAPWDRWRRKWTPWSNCGGIETTEAELMVSNEFLIPASPALKPRLIHLISRGDNI